MFSQKSCQRLGQGAIVSAVGFITRAARVAAVALSRDCWRMAAMLTGLLVLTVLMMFGVAANRPLMPFLSLSMLKILVRTPLMVCLVVVMESRLYMLLLVFLRWQCASWSMTTAFALAWTVLTLDISFFCCWITRLGRCDNDESKALLFVISLSRNIMTT